MKRKNVILSTVVVALASVAVLVHTITPHLHHDDCVEIVSLLSQSAPCEDDHHHHHHDDCTFGSTMLLSTANDNHHRYHIAFAPNKRLTKAFDLPMATPTASIAVPLRTDNFITTLPVDEVPKIAPAHRRSMPTRAPPIC
ncbi:MAG: hypothetical protein ACI31A_04490 [Candidatus Limisoma sp.]